MIIKKILNITSIGRFSDYNLKPNTDWDGSFKKVNVIYAPNGSGKTTLASILKSLSSLNVTNLQLKRTFNCQYPQHVKILTEPNSTIELDGEWTPNDLKIEVLDILFIEEYLFSGSILNKHNKLNLFKLLAGDKAEDLNSRYRTCKNKFKNIISQKRPHIITDIAKEEAISMAKLELDQITKEIEEIIENNFKQYIKVGNKYLEKFAPYLKFDSFEIESLTDNSTKLRLKLIIDVHGEKIGFNSPDLANKIPNVKLTLSEGDKSAVAICFFLARLDVLGYTNKIIVFDDPLSSFDYGRKLTTINVLSKIAENSLQFFLLTHDLHFAKDFCEKSNHKQLLNLKIENDGNTSSFQPHKIDLDILTSLQKDFQVISNYLKTEIANDFERREIIRCIRPILEGVLKTKYFELISNNEWLGDIISKIRNSSTESRLFKLNDFIDDIIELNDFSKRFHHSNNSGLSDIINPFELKKYIELLMKTIDRI